MIHLRENDKSTVFCGLRKNDTDYWLEFYRIERGVLFCSLDMKGSISWIMNVVNDPARASFVCKKCLNNNKWRDSLLEHELQK